MIKTIIMYLIVFLNFCLESTWFNNFSIFGVRFNAAILLVIFFALQGDEKEGACLGFVTGVLQDIVIGKIFGFYSIIGLLLGFASGYLNKRFVKDNGIVAVIFGFLGTFIYELFIYLVLFIGKGYYSITNYLLKMILPVSIGNMLISFFIFKLAVYLSNKYGIKKAVEF